MEHPNPKPERMDVTTPSGAYPVYVGAGLLDLLPLAPFAGQSQPQAFSSRCALVTNPRVGRLYAVRVERALRTGGFDPQVIEIPDGEAFKTPATVNTIYDALVEARLDRRSILFALGGGVTGDMAGYAAATFLRGVPLVHLPTTVLAMVDASVGGKVAVDHPRGKNLIGAFKQPLAVIADTDTLATLPEAEWRAGLAEAIKHGILRDPHLFELFEAASAQADPLAEIRTKAGEWMGAAIRVKVEYVVQDPFEEGKRAELNLGHTFGHAFETLSNFELRHGDAVAMGCVCAARLAVQRHLASPEWATRIETLFARLGLPTQVPRGLSADAIVDAMQTDKKRVDGRLRFILPRALGDIVIVDDITRQELVSLFS